MATLTKGAREALADEVVKNATADKIEWLKAIERQAAKDLYLHLYEPYLSLMEQLPRGAFYNEDWVRFNLGGVWSRVSLDETVPVFPPFTADTVDRFNLQPDNEAYVAWRVANDAVDEAKNKAAKLRFKTLSALNGVRTVKQLEAKWPKMYKVFKRLYPEQCAQLPALMTEELDQELGL